MRKKIEPWESITGKRVMEYLLKKEAHAYEIAGYVDKVSHAEMKVCPSCKAGKLKMGPKDSWKCDKCSYSGKAKATRAYRRVHGTLMEFVESGIVKVKERDLTSPRARVFFMLTDKGKEMVQKAVLVKR